MLVGQGRFDEISKHMKRTYIILIALVIATLQSCVVKSIHPYYHTRDIVTRKEFVNNWIDGDGQRWTIEQNREVTNQYKMTWRNDKNQTVIFIGTLFELNKQIYIDFLLEDFSCENEYDLNLVSLHIMPVHTVAKVQRISEKEISIKWFNEKWMKSLFEQNKIKIAHEIINEDEKEKSAQEYVLTASTDELQKFLVKYGNEDSNFDDNNTVWLNLRRDQ